MTTTPTTHSIQVTQEDFARARTRPASVRWCQSCPLAQATLRQLDMHEVMLGSTGGTAIDKNKQWYTIEFSTAATDFIRRVDFPNSRVAPTTVDITLKPVAMEALEAEAQ